MAMKQITGRTIDTILEQKEALQKAGTFTSTVLAHEAELREEGSWDNTLFDYTSNVQHMRDPATGKSITFEVLAGAPQYDGVVYQRAANKLFVISDGIVIQKSSHPREGPMLYGGTSEFILAKGLARALENPNTENPDIHAHKQLAERLGITLPTPQEACLARRVLAHEIMNRKNTDKYTLEGAHVLTGLGLENMPSRISALIPALEEQFHYNQR